MACDFCKNNKSLFWCDNSNEHAIREVYLELDGSVTVQTNIIDLYESSKNQKWEIPLTARDSCNFSIRYCPMCGDKFGGE